MGYDSPYGTGNRTASITVTKSSLLMGYDIDPAFWVNGNKVSQADYFNGTAVSGKYIRFQFAVQIIVDHLMYYQDLTTNQGTWKVQGSDNGADWTDIGSSFTLGGAAVQEIDISANVTPYTYYQIIGVSGNSSNAPWVREMEFSWTYPASYSVIKTIDGVAYADIKSVDGLAIASMKKY